MKLPKTLSIVCLSIVCLTLTACGSIADTGQPAPEAVAGVLDLREWDFEKNGPLELTGEWVFYWDVLIPPDEIELSELPPTYVPVPDVWTDYELGDVGLSPEGYAT
ncbi:MAG: hypothetical protein ACK2T5_09395, partial [Anaerolineales bacterium]